MATPNPTDRYKNDDATIRRRVAEQHVGQDIRVARSDRWNTDKWTTIVMVIASRGELRWLIEYYNGDTDAVPIFDNPNHFDLAQ